MVVCDVDSAGRVVRRVAAPLVLVLHGVAPAQVDTTLLPGMVASLPHGRARHEGAQRGTIRHVGSRPKLTPDISVLRASNSPRASG